jgi:hypothetical protein
VPVTTANPKFGDVHELDRVLAGLEQGLEADHGFRHATSLATSTEPKEGPKGRRPVNLAPPVLAAYPA